MHWSWPIINCFIGASVAEAMAAVTRHLLIEGRVQGVFYRAWSIETAQALGLSGWVRNRREGTVEMVLCGAEDRIQAMIDRCWRGPPSAAVEQVHVSRWSGPVGQGFEKRPSA